MTTLNTDTGQAVIVIPAQLRRISEAITRVREQLKVLPKKWEIERDLIVLSEDVDRFNQDWKGVVGRVEAE